MLLSFSRYSMRYIVKIFPGSPFRIFRNTLWRIVGFKVDKTANLLPTAILICTDISIGPETFIGEEVMITGGTIKIGARCDLAPRVVVHAGSHEIGNGFRRAGASYAGEVIIGDGTWIGTGAIILAGARIGSGVLVAAGSVVKTGEYPDNCLIAGTPAIVKKKFESSGNWTISR
jgi:acetyltransferase-like isoleucine patch superfamily enzyme